jgi:hypothetical protein
MLHCNGRIFTVFCWYFLCFWILLFFCCTVVRSTIAATVDVLSFVWESNIDYNTSKNWILEYTVLS